MRSERSPEPISLCVRGPCARLASRSARRSAPEDLHRLGFVLVWDFSSASRHMPGEVSDAPGRFRSCDMLTARPAGTINIDAQILSGPPHRHLQVPAAPQPLPRTYESVRLAADSPVARYRLDGRAGHTVDTPIQNLTSRRRPPPQIIETASFTPRDRGSYAAATVAVAAGPEDAMWRHDKDLRIDFIVASGAGGQHVHKTEIGVASLTSHWHCGRGCRRKKPSTRTSQGDEDPPRRGSSKPNVNASERTGRERAKGYRLGRSLRTPSHYNFPQGAFPITASTSRLQIGPHSLGDDLGNRRCADPGIRRAGLRPTNGRS